MRATGRDGSGRVGSGRNGKVNGPGRGTVPRDGTGWDGMGRDEFLVEIFLFGWYVLTTRGFFFWRDGMGRDGSGRVGTGR